jgi:hypothetical protein
MKLFVLNRIQFIAVLSLKIALKAHNLQNLVRNEIKCETIFTTTEARLLPNATPTQNRLPPNVDSARP